MESKIQQMRIQRGMTQLDLARMVGISESAYQLYEYGRREPKARTASRIAKALGTTVETLWSGNSAR